MATQTHRTTFSLDDQAIQRLKTLSRRWKVSQAEVVRRALEAAEQLPYRESAIQALAEYHKHGGLAAEKANEYLSQWSEGRDDWARE